MVRNLHTSGNEAGHVQYENVLFKINFSLYISTGFMALFIDIFKIPTIQRHAITDKTFSKA